MCEFALSNLQFQDDISGRLMSKPTQVTDDEVFNEELGKYADTRQKLDANFAQQVSLLSRIQVILCVMSPTCDRKKIASLLLPAKIQGHNLIFKESKSSKD